MKRKLMLKITTKEWDTGKADKSIIRVLRSIGIPVPSSGLMGKKAKNIRQHLYLSKDGTKGMYDDKVILEFV